MIVRSTISSTPMNKTEAAWARELQMRKRLRRLQWFAFEPMKLRLGDKCFYTPDFVAVDAEGRVVAFEVKGFWRDDARAKIKVAASQYPWIQFIAVSKGKRSGPVWEIEEIKSHHSEVVA